MRTASELMKDAPGFTALASVDAPQWYTYGGSFCAVRSTHGVKLKIVNGDSFAIRRTDKNVWVTVASEPEHEIKLSPEEVQEHLVSKSRALMAAPISALKPPKRVTFEG